MDRIERDRLVSRLRRDAARIADHFDLNYRSLDAEHPRVKARYGVCYDDGRIKIRLCHALTGHPLKYSSLIDTVCHELAHLKHFNHGPAFKAFYLRLLAWARREKIYRPRSVKRKAVDLQQSAPVQPRRRNGVPVFVASQRTDALPWERDHLPGVALDSARVVDCRKAKPESSPPKTKRSSSTLSTGRAEDKKRSSRQLALFDL